MLSLNSSKMLRPTTVMFSILLVLFVGNVSAFDCEWGGSQSLLDKWNVLNPKSCPTPIDSSAKMFCCTDSTTGLNTCCELQDFLGLTWFIVIIAVIIISVISIILCLVRCFCCCCN